MNLNIVEIFVMFTPTICILILIIFKIIFEKRLINFLMKGK